MTEPVAYKIEDVSETLGWRYSTLKPVNKNYVPLYTADQLYPRVKMTQAEFDELETSLINAQFDYSELKKTIEIVPDMKWFVRSKEFDDGVYKVLVDNRLDYYEYSNVDNDEETAEYGHAFDTKELAELWTNPLTEAVQLEVKNDI